MHAVMLLLDDGDGSNTHSLLMRVGWFTQILVLDKSIFASRGGGQVAGKLSNLPATLEKRFLERHRRIFWLNIVL